jgi:peptide/nickel transport system permease protein
MTAFIIRRLLLALLTLLLVSLAVFFVMRLLPGDPLLIYMAQNMEFDTMPVEALNELRREFGLDKPIMAQYFNWITDILRGDFGTSIFYREKVGKLMLERFPVTLHLGLLALLCTVFIGLAVGLIAAIQRGSWPERILTPFRLLP